MPTQEELDAFDRESIQREVDKADAYLDKGPRPGDQDWEDYLDALYLGDRVDDVEPGYADFDPLDKDWEYGAGIDRQFFGRSDDGEPYVWERTG